MRSVFVISFVLCVGQLYGQNHTVTFKTWGLYANYNARSKCAQSLQSEYGFRYEVVAGCVVRSGQVRRWKRHNRRSERKMVDRLGSNWREKYDYELEACRSKAQE